MKIRIHENSLRVRLNKEELEMLRKSLPVETCLFFPDGASLTLQVKQNDGFLCTYKEGNISICIPEKEINALKNTPQYMIAHKWSTDNKLKLSILVELDMMN